MTLRRRFRFWLTQLMWDVGSNLRYRACLRAGGRHDFEDGARCYVCGVFASDVREYERSYLI